MLQKLGNRRFGSKVRQGEEGFALIAVVILVLVAGLVAVPAIDMYNKKKQSESHRAKVAKLGDISEALRKYALLNGKLPAPADPTLPMTDANAAKAVTSWPQWTSKESTNKCKIGSDSVNGVYCRPGRRNLDGTSALEEHKSNSATEQVLIGALPAIDLGMMPEDALDSNGFKYTYAVAITAINDSTFDNGKGNISVVRDDNQSKNIGSTNSDILYLIMSHGENGSGAYKDNGQRNECEEGMLEYENCNDDATFVGLTDKDGNFVKEGSYNVGEKKSYYDDIITFVTDTTGNFWTPNGEDSMNMTSGSDQMGQVTIGYSGNVTPKAQLDVNGDVRADKLITQRLCNYSASYCITVDNIVNNTSGSTSYLKCGALGLKSINQASSGGSAYASGVCDADTHMPEGDNTLGTPDADGVICPNGSGKLDKNGKFVCK